MKIKVIILLLLGIMSFRSHAQGMPVYDNTNFISLTKSLLESAKQTSQLLKTVEFLREQKQRLDEVSSVVKQVRAVQEIVSNNQELISMVQKDLREILNSPFIKENEIDRVSRSFKAIIEVALQDMDFMQQLLTSNLISMTDAERLEVLEAQKERSRELIAETNLRTKRYRAIISFREMQDKINNRKSKF